MSRRATLEIHNTERPGHNEHDNQSHNVSYTLAQSHGTVEYLFRAFHYYFERAELGS